MSTQSRGGSILHYFGFLGSYALSATGAVAVLACSLAFAVFSNKPEEQTPISAAMTQVAPPAFQQVVENSQQKVVDTLDLQEFNEANLSPAQWKDLKLLLDVLPSAAKDMKQTLMYADSRRDMVLGYGDFVFAHYDKLPQQSKDDWQSLKNTPIGRGPEASDCLALQQMFISKTASVTEVRSILELRQKYETVRSQFLKTMLQIDRLMPFLYVNGLPRRTRQNSDYGAIDPGAKFSDFVFAEVGNSAKPTVAKLPKVEMTAEQMMRQLKDPPMSTGKTSADRAAQ